MSITKKKYLIPIVIVLIITIFLFLLSTFTRNYLVKNSDSLVGRKISIGEIHFNYLKISIDIKDFVMFEENSIDSFITFNELYINFNPWTLIRNEYSFSEIRLINPYTQIVQNADHFNFSDLIPKDDSVGVEEQANNEEIKFTIQNIKIDQGKINYIDVPKDNLVKLNDLGLDLPIISWNNKSSEIGVDFRIGEKGQVTVNAVVDNVKDEYHIHVSTTDVDIKPVAKYLTDYFHASDVEGYLSSKIEIIGDMNDVMDFRVTGLCHINDLSVFDSNSEKIISTSKITTSLKDINLKNNNYSIGRIVIDRPDLLLIRDTKMTNIERFILPYFRNDSIQSASGDTIESGPPLKYSIDSIRVVDGHLSFSDRTLNRPFTYEFDELNFLMTKFTESADRIPIEFSMVANKKGEFSGKTVWSMYEPMNFEMDLIFNRLDLLSFSPYSEFYIASPIIQGWFNYKIKIMMTPTSLKNLNTVKIDELEFGKRTKDTTAINVPIRLGLYLMKDAKDKIEFEIPVSGNPSNPEFKLGRIIWKAFGNMMLKAVSSPFNAMKGLAGTNPETLEKLPFELGQDTLTQDQRDKLERLATILKKKPELLLILTQTTDPIKEKVHLAKQITKTEYAKTQTSDPEALKRIVQETTDDNQGLIDFVRKSVPEIDQIGFDQACVKKTGQTQVESRFMNVISNRNQALSEYMINKQGIPAESVQISIADLNNLPQELRISQYKIEVSMK